MDMREIGRKRKRDGGLTFVSIQSQEVYSLMKDISELQSEMFVERVRMSSAWAKAPKL